MKNFVPSLIPKKASQTVGPHERVSFMKSPDKRL